MGHLPLYLRALAPPRLSRKVSGEPQTRSAAYPLLRKLLGIAKAGAQLAELHINYETQPEYEQLKWIQTPPLNWCVEKMKLSKDKRQLKYNDFLTLDGIPPEVYTYRLGTRSALEWVIDQYRVKRDKRSGIVNDPNRAGVPRYIVDLIGRVINVSLKTGRLLTGCPRCNRPPNYFFYNEKTDLSRHFVAESVRWCRCARKRNEDKKIKWVIWYKKGIKLMKPQTIRYGKNGGVEIINIDVSDPPAVLEILTYQLENDDSF